MNTLTSPGIEFHRWKFLFGHNYSQTFFLEQLKRTDNFLTFYSSLLWYWGLWRLVQKQIANKRDKRILLIHDEKEVKKCNILCIFSIYLVSFSAPAWTSILGAGFGGLALGVILTALFCYCRNRSANKQNSPKAE